MTKGFTIDVETENYENAYFENDKFLCYEDDYDAILNRLNELHEENKELKYRLNRTEKELPQDKNGYNKIICPMCCSDLKYSRFIGYMNGEQYEEFDCTQCDFTGRIRKGNLWDDVE